MTTQDIDYLLIGHIASDIVPGGRALGGTVGYAAAIAQAFGLRVGLLTSARADEPLLADLPSGVQVVNIPALSTTTYENIYTPQGRVQYVRAVAERLVGVHVPRRWRHAPLVHIAPIADEVDNDMLTLFDGAVLVTPQGFMRQWGDDGRVRFKRWMDEAMLNRADFVILSEEDIAAAPELAEVYRARAQTLFITNGDLGGRYTVNEEVFTYDAVPTIPTDLTGAGDIFASSFFCAWHRLGTIHQAVKIGAKVAAYSVTQSGIMASAPSHADVENWLGGWSM